MTIFHIHGHDSAAVETALETIFVREERPPTLRLEGTYSAVLARALDPDLPATYRYLLLRPHDAAPWTPLLELGNRTEGLEIELSRELGGAPVVALFVYGEVVSGYRVARDGALVDRYVSDPLAFADSETERENELDAAAAILPTTPTAPEDVGALRGQPERFGDLLPAGTTPEDFARVVLLPGWWEEHAAGTPPASPVASAASADAEDGEEEEELVDEADRLRCIALALELWGPSEYPFAGELEEIPNRAAGPATALAFA
jgi:hypothetical protein